MIAVGVLENGKNFRKIGLSTSFYKLLYRNPKIELLRTMDQLPANKRKLHCDWTSINAFITP